LVAFSQISNAANALHSTKKGFEEYKCYTSIVKGKNTYEFRQLSAITIGLTDACGVCHDYTISGTWGQIWQLVGYIELFYEMGYCGTVQLIPN